MTLTESNKFDLEIFYLKTIANQCNFKQIRNTGKLTVNELVEFTTKIKNILVDYDDQLDQFNSFNNIKLNNEKLIIANQLSNKLFNELKLRTKNSIYTLIGEKKFNLEKFYFKAIDRPCNFNEIKNTGKLSISEINNFISKIGKLLNDINNNEINKFTLLRKEIESVLLIDLENDTDFIRMLKSKQLNLIYFFDRYVLNSESISTIEKYILSYLLNQGTYSVKEKEVFKKIASRSKLSYERIRQIRKDLLTSFSTRFSYIFSLFEYSFDLNNLINKSFWEVEKQPVFSRQTEFVENSEITLSNLLGLFGRKNFYILNQTQIISKIYNPYKREIYQSYKYFKFSYLISSDFLSKKILLKVLDSVLSKLCSRNKEDNFYDFNDFKLNNNQKLFVIDLTTKNFNLEYYKDQGVLFKRNTKIKPEQIIEKILKNKNDLMTAQEVWEQYNLNYEVDKKPLSTIRAYLTKDKNKFIFLRGGRGKAGKTLYGLKAWEQSKKIKSGSIRDIAINYLDSSSEPVHIFAITKHIQQFRSTTLHNVRANIKLAPEVFRFFDSGFIGLQKKDYKKINTQYNSIAPRDSYTISEFLKNHLFYDYSKLVKKFTDDLNLRSAQVEFIIYQKCVEGIFKVKNNRIYFNMIEEGTLINYLFKNYNRFSIYGFNPFKITSNKKNIYCRIIIQNRLLYKLKKEHTKFSNYEVSNSVYRSILIYHNSTKGLVFYYWKNKYELNRLIGDIVNFKSNTGKIISKLKSQNKLILKSEKLNSLPILLENIFEDNKISTKNEMPLINIDGMNKLEAIGKIIDYYEDKRGAAIDLNEAKRIYNLIKINS
jgi:hypothetical protein